MVNGNHILKAEILTQFGVDENDLKQLCRKHGVKSLAVFGTVANKAFQIGTSDIDFLVEFDFVSVDKFFDLLEGLKTLFHYEDIDLVTMASLKNKIIRNEILSSHEQIYAA